MKRLWRNGRSLTAVAFILASPAMAMAGIDATYTGPSGGLWSDMTNWDTGVVPDSLTMSVLIDGTAASRAVMVDGNYDVGDLTIDANDAITIENNRTLRVGGGSTVMNAGTITFGSIGNNTNLLPTGAGAVTFTGGGEIVGENFASWIYASGGSSVVFMDQTVRGTMRLGWNQSSVDNLGGTIVAEGGTLELDPGTAGMINTGTLASDLGGELIILSSSYTNVGGLVEARAGATTTMSGSSTFDGGTFRSIGDGLLRTGGTSVIWDGTVNPVTLEGQLTLENNTRLSVRGTFNNNGVVSLESVGNNTILHWNTDEVQLQGGGLITTTDSPANWMYATAGGSLVNVDNTIRASGQFGWNQSALTNHADIIADKPNNKLIVDPGSDGMLNTGTMRAENGALLELVAPDYDNVAGVIEAADGSAVHLSGSVTIDGGIIRSSGSGEIYTSGTPVIDGTVNLPTIEGNVRIQNNQRLALRGTINNSAAILLDSAGNNTYLHFNGGPVTLQGGGTIDTTDQFANWLYATAGGSLINMDHTIRAAGHIGWNQSAITNHATIIADKTNILEIDPGSAGMINDGTLRAENGATMHLLPSHYDNDGGLIEAIDGSTILLAGATRVSGGTLRSLSGSEFITSGTPILDGSVDIPTLEGDVRVINNTRLALEGTVNNTGTILLDGMGNNTYLHFDQGPVMLTGGGEVVTSDSLAIWIYARAGGSIINVDNTIRGAGNFGWNQSAITNEAAGTIIADQTNRLEIDPGSAGMMNHGTMQVTNNAELRVLAGPFETDGTVTVDAGALFNRTGDFVMNGGSTTVEGELRTNSDVIINNGALLGNGLIDSDILVDGGGVFPGSPEDVAGTLSVEGTYGQTLDGVFIVDIGGLAAGTEHDVLAIDGDANLAGTIKIQPINGYAPNVGDQFVVLTTTGAVNGAFQFGICEDQFNVTYTANSVVVTTVGTVAVGDINCDGAVNVIDLLALLSDWGPCAGFACAADLNADETVNVLDLLIVLANWS